MDETTADTIAIRDRFLADQLLPNPTAKVLHFTPKQDGRDEFGNRIFSSPLSYIDREKREVKAAILVSPLGEAFIHSHKGILQDLDRGLKMFSEKRKHNDISLLDEQKPTIEVSPFRQLTWIHAGGQSQTLLLETDGKKYIVKANASLTTEYRDFSQPYINEMLQTLQLAKALKEELQAAHMELSSFLFATGYMSVTEFVEGNHTIKPNDTSSVISVLNLADKFVANRKKEHDPLWQNINFDFGYDKYNSIRMPTSNMIQHGETIVWVDPFYHTQKSL